MQEVSFNASTHTLPVAPTGHRLDTISFRTCPGSSLKLKVLQSDGSVDQHGVAKDSWYTIRCKDLPPRFVRLYNGTKSLSEFLRRYGFLDADGCLNHRDAVSRYVPRHTPFPPESELLVPHNMRQKTGVPQFYRNSGVCWYASLCWSSFANKNISDLLLAHIPPKLKPLCEGCLSDREKAQQLRNALWYDYRVGDNVDDHPSRDGRNGFTEFTTLCAKLDVPMIRYKEHMGKMKLMSPK